ncbi:DUF6443 domain-containing protein [Reichenbachiella sp.]|uniref:DUF6443 domain-containing protein n=1 Tax=Reichenbachiella sp. TaxID=2184521 RepID=UPI003BB016E3
MKKNLLISNKIIALIFLVVCFCCSFQVVQAQCTTKPTRIDGGGVLCNGTKTLEVIPATTGGMFQVKTKWYKNNTYLGEVTGFTKTVNSSGTYSAELSINGQCYSPKVYTTITTPTVTGGTIKKNGDICTGADVFIPTLSFTTASSGGTVYWQRKASGGSSYTDIGTGPTYTLSINDMTSNAYYRADTRGTCQSAVSNEIYITRTHLNQISFSGMGDLSKCPGEAISLAGATPSGGSWSGTGVSGNSFQSAFPGTYSVTYTYSQNNCSTSKSVNVVVHEKTPVPDGISDERCGQGDVTLTMDVNEDVPDLQQGKQYYWYNNSGSLVATSEHMQVSLNEGQVKNFQAAMSLDNYQNCVSDKVPVVAQSLQALNGGIIEKDKNICTGGVLEYPILSSVEDPSGSDGNFAISWLRSLTNSNNESNWSVVGSGLSYTLQGLDGAESAYYKRKVYSSACDQYTYSNTVFVQVGNYPVLDLSGVETSVCQGADLSLSGASPSGGIWSGNGVSGNTFNNYTPGTYDLTYTVTTAIGCQASEVISAVVNEIVGAPAIEIKMHGPTQTSNSICPENEMRFEAVSNSKYDIEQYKWTLNGVLLSANLSHSVVSFNASDLIGSSIKFQIEVDPGTDCIATESEELTLTEGVNFTVVNPQIHENRFDLQAVKNVSNPSVYQIKYANAQSGFKYYLYKNENEIQNAIGTGEELSFTVTSFGTYWMLVEPLDNICNVSYTSNGVRLCENLANCDNSIETAEYKQVYQVAPITRNAYSVRESTSYFDGIGRGKLIVQHEQTASENEIIQVKVFDDFGRETKSYLTHSSSELNSLILDEHLVNQNAFYDNHFGTNDGDHAYSETEFEPSPLNRPLKTFAPGQAWGKAGGNKPMTFDYQTNLADEVIRWELEGEELKKLNTYDPGTLYKTVTTDENGNQVQEFTDLRGRVVLKKVQESASAPTSDENWLQTYYIYDDFGNLRFVLPPAAIRLSK